MLKLRRTVLNSVNLIHYIASQSQKENWNENLRQERMLLKLGGMESLTYIASMRDAVLGRWCRIEKNEVGVVRGQVGGQQVA